MGGKGSGLENKGKTIPKPPRNPTAVMNRIDEFINLYLLNGGHSGEAYKQVFPTSKPEYADMNAARYMRNPKVQARLLQVQAEIRARQGWEKEVVVTEIIKRYAQNIEGTTGEKNVAVKLMQMYIDIAGLKAPIQNVNYNIDATPLEINFTSTPIIDITPQQIEGEEPNEQ